MKSGEVTWALDSPIEPTSYDLSCHMVRIADRRTDYQASMLLDDLADMTGRMQRNFELYKRAAHATSKQSALLRRISMLRKDKPTTRAKDRRIEYAKKLVEFLRNEEAKMSLKEIIETFKKRSQLIEELTKVDRLKDVEDWFTTDCSSLRNVQEINVSVAINEGHDFMKFYRKSISEPVASMQELYENGLSDRHQTIQRKKEIRDNRKTLKPSYFDDTLKPTSSNMRQDVLDTSLVDELTHLVSKISSSLTLAQAKESKEMLQAIEKRMIATENTFKELTKTAKAEVMELKKLQHHTDELMSARSKLEESLESLKLDTSTRSLAVGSSGTTHIDRGVQTVLRNIDVVSLGSKNHFSDEFDESDSESSTFDLPRLDSCSSTQFSDIDLDDEESGSISLGAMGKDDTHVTKRPRMSMPSSLAEAGEHAEDVSIEGAFEAEESKKDDHSKKSHKKKQRRRLQHKRRSRGASQSDDHGKSLESIASSSLYIQQSSDSAHFQEQDLKQTSGSSKVLGQIDDTQFEELQEKVKTIMHSFSSTLQECAVDVVNGLLLPLRVDTRKDKASSEQLDRELIQANSALRPSMDEEVTSDELNDVAADDVRSKVLTRVPGNHKCPFCFCHSLADMALALSCPAINRESKMIVSHCSCYLLALGTCEHWYASTTESFLAILHTVLDIETAILKKIGSKTANHESSSGLDVATGSSLNICESPPDLTAKDSKYKDVLKKLLGNKKAQSLDSLLDKHKLDSSSYLNLIRECRQLLDIQRQDAAAILKKEEQLRSMEDLQGWVTGANVDAYLQELMDRRHTLNLMDMLKGSVCPFCNCYNPSLDFASRPSMDASETDQNTMIYGVSEMCTALTGVFNYIKDMMKDAGPSDPEAMKAEHEILEMALNTVFKVRTIVKEQLKDYENHPTERKYKIVGEDEFMSLIYKSPGTAEQGKSPHRLDAMNNLLVDPHYIRGTQLAFRTPGHTNQDATSGKAILSALGYCEEVDKPPIAHTAHRKRRSTIRRISQTSAATTKQHHHQQREDAAKKPEKRRVSVRQEEAEVRRRSEHSSAGQKVKATEFRRDSVSVSTSQKGRASESKHDSEQDKAVKDRRSSMPVSMNQQDKTAKRKRWSLPVSAKEMAAYERHGSVPASTSQQDKAAKGRRDSVPASTSQQDKATKSRRESVRVSTSQQDKATKGRHLSEPGSRHQLVDDVARAKKDDKQRSSVVHKKDQTSERNVSPSSGTPSTRPTSPSSGSTASSSEFTDAQKTEAADVQPESSLLSAERKDQPRESAKICVIGKAFLPSPDQIETRDEKSLVTESYEDSQETRVKDSPDLSPELGPQPIDEAKVFSIDTPQELVIQGQSINEPTNKSPKKASQGTKVSSSPFTTPFEDKASPPQIDNAPKDKYVSHPAGDEVMATTDRHMHPIQSIFSRDRGLFVIKHYEQPQDSKSEKPIFTKLIGKQVDGSGTQPIFPVSRSPPLSDDDLPWESPDNSLCLFPPSVERPPMPVHLHVGLPLDVEHSKKKRPFRSKTQRSTSLPRSAESGRILLLGKYIEGFGKAAPTHREMKSLKKLMADRRRRRSHMRYELHELLEPLSMGYVASARSSPVRKLSRSRDITQANVARLKEMRKPDLTAGWLWGSGLCRASRESGMFLEGKLSGGKQYERSEKGQYAGVRPDQRAMPRLHETLSSLAMFSPYYEPMKTWVTNVFQPIEPQTLELREPHTVKVGTAVPDARRGGGFVSTSSGSGLATRVPLRTLMEPSSSVSPDSQPRLQTIPSKVSVYVTSSQLECVAKRNTVSAQRTRVYVKRKLRAKMALAGVRLRRAIKEVELRILGQGVKSFPAARRQFPDTTVAIFQMAGTAALPPPPPPPPPPPFPEPSPGGELGLGLQLSRCPYYRRVASGNNDKSFWTSLNQLRITPSLGLVRSFQVRSKTGMAAFQRADHPESFVTTDRAVHAWQKESGQAQAGTSSGAGPGKGKDWPLEEAARVRTLRAPPGNKTEAETSSWGRAQFYQQDQPPSTVPGTKGKGASLLPPINNPWTGTSVSSIPRPSVSPRAGRRLLDHLDIQEHLRQGSRLYTATELLDHILVPGDRPLLQDILDYQIPMKNRVHIHTKQQTGQRKDNADTQQATHKSKMPASQKYAYKKHASQK